MNTEPILKLCEFLRFDRWYYARNYIVLPNQAPEHFIETGQFRANTIRPFDESEFAAAVCFEPGTYAKLHGDVRESGVDPWSHFLAFGLREFRSTGATDDTETTFWSELGFKDWQQLTLNEKFSAIETANRELLALVVSKAISGPSTKFYKSNTARLLAKASLVIKWPSCASAFLNMYREGLAYVLPKRIAPPEFSIVCQKMPLEAYCRSRHMAFHEIEPAARTGTQPGTEGRAIAARLPKAAISGDGAVITADNIVLTDVSWAGPTPPEEVPDPDYRIIQMSRSSETVDANVMSLLRGGPTSDASVILDALPRLLALQTSSRHAGSNREALVCLTRPEQERIVEVALQRADLGLPRISLRTVGAARSLRVRSIEVVGRTAETSGDADCPPFLDWLKNLRDRLVVEPSQARSFGIFLCSDAVASSKIENSRDLGQHLSGLGIQRHNPRSATASTRIDVGRALVIVVGSTNDAWPLAFAHAGTPVCVANANGYLTGAIKHIAAALELPVEYAGALSQPDPRLGSSDTGSIISTQSVDDALSRLLGGDAFDELLRRRQDLLPATAFLRNNRPDTLRDLESIARELYNQTAPIGRWCFDSRLDKICSELGSAELAETVGRPSPGVRVYYATELYKSGGHTRLIEDFVEAYPADRHHIICTALPDLNNGYTWREILRTSTSVNLHIVPFDLDDRLHETMKLIAQIRPQTLFQLAHPYDPIGAAILNKDLADKVVLVHHNDHSFCLGPSSPGIIHLTLHQRFRHLLDAKLGIRSSFIPLTSHGGGRLIQWRDGMPLLTASSGAQPKFVPRRERRYADFLSARFSAREGNHAHIGPLDPTFKKELEAELDARGFAGRLLHISWTPSLSKTLADLGVHLYLNSYPIGGGTALIDAMSIGAPICKGEYDERLDSAGVSYPGCLTWRSMSDFSYILRNLTSQDLENQRQIAIAHFNENHLPDVFALRLRQIIEATQG